MTKPFWNAARAAQHRRPHKRSVLQAIGTPLPEAVASFPGCKGCGYIKCSCPKVMARNVPVTVPASTNEVAVPTPTPYEIHRLDYNRSILYRFLSQHPSGDDGYDYMYYTTRKRFY